MDSKTIMTVKSGVISEKSGNDYLVLAGQSDEQCVYLSEVSAAIYELCDGKNTVSDIINRILEMYDVQFGECEQDVHSCINDLIELDILEGLS